MEIKNKINIHNRFDIEVRDKNTGELKQKAVAYNIVLSQMFTRLCGGLSYFVNIHFGSGTGTLSAARTSLFSHLGTKAAADEQIIKAIPLSTWKRKIVLNPEEYVGSTISEVGIAFGSTNTNLVTHSLLKDSEGNSISIVKTDVDVITIYATVFVTFDTSNPNLVYISMPSGNTLVNYLIGGGTAPTGAFSLNDTPQAEFKLGSTASVTWTSDTVNKQRKTNVLRFGTTVGNGHVKFLEFANVFNLEFPYSTVFNGQSYDGVNLGVGDGVVDKFNLPSANIKDGSLIVKKNGVVVINDVDYSIEDESLFFRSRQAIKHSIQNNGTRCSISGNGEVVGYFSVATPNVIVSSRQIDGTYSTMSFPFSVSGAKNGAFSYDGKMLVIGSSRSPYVTAYKFVSGAWVQIDTPLGLGGEVRALKLCNNGSVLITFRVSGQMKRYNLIDDVWVDSGTTFVTVDGINDMDATEDANVIASAGYVSPNLRVYDWNGSSYVARPAVPSPSGANGFEVVSLSFDGSVVCIVSYNGVRVYDWTGSSWIQRPNIPQPDSSSYGGISKDGYTFIIGGNGSCIVYKWNGVSWTRTYTYSQPYSIVSFCSSLNGEICTTGFNVGYGGVYIYSLFLPLKMMRVEFSIPPAIGDVITADYTVDGVHKTYQYVIDVSMAVQFGEGS